MSPEDLPKPGVAIRRAADRMLAGTADAVDEIVGSEPFSKNLARGMAMTARTVATVRGVTRSIGGFTASWFNIPTRQQVIELSKRVLSLELVLDDIDARTAELLNKSTTDEPAD